MYLARTYDVVPGARHDVALIATRTQHPRPATTLTRFPPQVQVAAEVMDVRLPTIHAGLHVVESVRDHGEHRKASCGEALCGAGRARLVRTDSCRSSPSRSC